MEQFTASEVRDAIAWFYGDKLTRISAMLTAFADLLEAREKAEPVYQHRSKNGSMLRWFDCSEETFMAMEYNEHDKEHFDRRILYTHPAPSDAGEVIRIHPDVAKAQAIPFDVNDGRPTKSAQAQPPAKSKYAPPYPDQAQDPFWKVPGMVDTRPKAQPPAASVTDGFVFERVNMGRGNERYVGLADGSEGTTVREDGDGPGDTRSRLLWRIADAALAAQEDKE